MAAKATSKFDLHEALNSRSYDHAVICTFTFDASFFEEYCLEKFSSLCNNGNITVILDRGMYERIILGPESERPRKANLRYLLHPISTPGVFHPKVFLLASKNKVRLIIGSANFTRPGITSNAEMVGCYDYDADKDESFRYLFQAVFNYLTDISNRWHSDNFVSNLVAISRDASWLLSEEEPESNDLTFLHNLTTPLWDQLTAQITPPVDNIYILSRYFDLRPDILNRVDGDLRPSRIKIFTQNGITNMTPEWLEHPLVKSGKAEILLCRYTDGGNPQPLHAKSIVVEKDKQCVFVFGSANFTTAALLRTAQFGNIEILLRLPTITYKTLRPESLFDPDETAIRLKEEGSLQTSRSEEEGFERAGHIITLLEATLDLNRENISISASVPPDKKYEHLFAKLTFQNQANKCVEINHAQDQKYSMRISKEVSQRIDTQSTIIQIEAFEGIEKVADSNSLLVTNLKDLKTDRPVRRERHVKEAQQSAAQFFTVLRDLIGTGDDEALLTFLNFCDIPISGVTRLTAFRGMKPIWDGGAGMRNLGEKNLKIYTHLHQAAIAFFDKHFRKLRRHVELRDLNGVANFLHIFLAMGGILRAQIERAVIGLESKTVPVTPEEWAECRNHIDTYYGRFKQLMDCLWKEYLSTLLREYKINDIRERFSPDLEPIHDLCMDMLNYRDRMETLRTSKLRHVNRKGQTILPSYFYCVLSPERWQRYSSDMRNELEHVERTIRYAA